jgi:histidine triad (HIT) family protein
MKDCLFCKIIKKEVPSHTVYEDKDFYAFLDIFPRTKGHTLVIPKKHYQWVYDVKEAGLYWETVMKITKKLQKVLNPVWVNYFTLGEVPHAHIHILPRFEPVAGALAFPSKIIQTENEELNRLSKLLRK